MGLKVTVELKQVNLSKNEDEKVKSQALLTLSTVRVAAGGVTTLISNVLFEVMKGEVDINGRYVIVKGRINALWSPYSMHAHLQRETSNVSGLFLIR